ncbi:hypothetical protein Tco_0752721 [Tanacetum coccineum]|uniref:Uncharacterized protein n=1 Tax=Tanacetum coccineum TaxID=301880 RepID=A0ABQ4Z8N3_9ASTR
MVKSWLVQDQTVLGKDYSNLLIADSLLKTIWFINAPCYGNEALASPKANELTIPEQTATGKGTSNPFMAENGDNFYQLAKRIELEKQRSFSNPYSLWSGRDAPSTGHKPVIASGRDMILRGTDNWLVVIIGFSADTGYLIGDTEEHCSTFKGSELQQVQQQRVRTSFTTATVNLRVISSRAVNIRNYHGN